MPARRILLLAVLTAAVPAQQDDPILAQLPANTTNVLVVRDLLPHVDALLGSASVRDLLAASGDLQQELFGLRLDAAALQKQIGLFRSLVPVEVVVAGSERTVAGVLAAFEAGLAAAVLPTLAGTETEALVEKLQAAALTALPQLAATELLAWVRTRDERTAEQWFDAIVEATAALPTDDGLAVEEQGERVTVRLRVLSAFGGTMLNRLTGAGVAVPADADPEIVFVVEQDGDRLQLRVGEPPTGPLAAERLGPLWASRTPPCAFAKVDPGEQEQRAYQFLEVLAELGETVEDEALAARLFSLTDRFETSFVFQTSSLVIGESVVVTQEVDVGDDADEVLDAPDPRVVRCLAADDGPFLLSALSLDVLLSGILHEFAQRVGRQGRPLEGAVVAAMEYLDGEESALFEPGALLVWRTAQCRSVAKWQLGAMPFAAAALIAPAVDAAAGAEFVQTLTAHLVPGLGENDHMWPERDLGLGLPTHVLDLAKAMPEFAAAGLDADFAPHWCAVDSLLIVSTDPKLTADLLQRARGDAKPALPVRVLIDWSRWSGEHWGEMCAGLAAWWRAVPPSSPSLQRFDVVLDVLAKLAESVVDLDMVTELDGATLREVSRLRLRQPK